MDQDVFDFICLLNANADTDTVDTGFDEDLLVLVSRDGEGVENQFRGGLSLDLGYIMTFGGLGSEVRDCKSGGKGGPNTLKIRAQ